MARPTGRHGGVIEVMQLLSEIVSLSYHFGQHRIGKALTDDCRNLEDLAYLCCEPVEAGGEPSLDPPAPPHLWMQNIPSPPAHNKVDSLATNCYPRSGSGRGSAR